jgi:hypothetical protein
MSAERANSVEVVMAQPGKVIADHDLMGEKLHATHSEAVHFGELSEDEKHLEKKLKRKIDSLIMPLVMLGTFTMQGSVPHDADTIQSTY